MMTPMMNIEVKYLFYLNKNNINKIKTKKIKI